MSLIKCPECSKEISDSAECCPHCGLPSQLFYEKAESHNDASLLELEERHAEKVKESLIDFFEKRMCLLDRNDFITSKQKHDIKVEFVELFLYFSSILDSKGKQSVPAHLRNENIGGFLICYESLDRDIDKHNEEYVEEELSKNSEYFDTILSSLDQNIYLDNEQRRAVVTDDDCCLLVAGAGSGKTTTMAAKIKYLVEKKNIAPEDILVFSFTNKATDELRRRVNDGLGINANISTFHSFGFEIIGMAAKDRPNLLRSPFWLISKILKEIIYHDNELLKKTVLFLGYYFDLPDSVFEFGSLEQCHDMRCHSKFESLKSELGEYITNVQNSLSKKKRTLNGEFLRSAEEVQIANFLFLNGLDYEYERPYPHPIPGSYKKYTPDFFIKQGKNETYLEHYGINKNGQNVRFNADELKTYQKRIKDKRLHHRKHGTKLIETYSACGEDRSVIDDLEKLLKSNGFELKQRDPKEIYEKISELDKDKYIQNFTEFMERFIELYKVSGYSRGHFSTLKEKCTDPRTAIFLDIAEIVYEKYQDILYANNEIDFADMINDAEKRLKDMESEGMMLPYKYVIIDEFQDIARQRFNLLQNLLNITDAKIIAVGDDWQSIFSFAGSEVTLFTKFVEMIGGGTEMQITRTYRNSQELIDIAGGSFNQTPHR